MEFETVTAPQRLDAVRYRRYSQSAKGKARTRRYDTSKKGKERDFRAREAEYLARPIVAWDGEGITLPSGEHIYVMLANSEGGYIANEKGLDTRTILEFVMGEYRRLPDALHVIFGGGYDWNMWLGSLRKTDIANVYRNEFARIGPYSVQWRRGKSFYLRTLGPKGSRKERGFTMYDVMPFFQCPFVKACDDYLGDKFYKRDLVVENKALRSSFTEADIPNVRTYNEAELVNLVRLVSELRERLNSVGLRPRRWDGPGAIASALMTREGIKNAKADTPEQIVRAARYAYAGGRFEPIRFGAVYAKAYEYDINSAYPHALRDVPDLTRGQWVPAYGDVKPHDFTLYKVRFDAPSKTLNLPAPLFRRHENGAISYPLHAAGWYWASEVYAAQEFVNRYGGSLVIDAGWHFVSDGSKPFAFITDLFEERKRLKALGDGAHVGIKLGLNSLYGKLAQQVGARWDSHRNAWRVPPFHQIEWAGYVTARCRSQVYLAAIDNLDCVIAYETDALFTSEPLDVNIGTGLGEWEATVFDSLTYAQSGVYYGTVGGKPVAKTRGVDRGTMTREQVEEAMLKPKARERVVTASLTRFVGAGLALHTSWSRWRRWERQTKEMTVQPSGKRWHDPACWCGNGIDGIEPGRWHLTICPFLNKAVNAAFPIVWANPDPNMSELEELRGPVEEFAPDATPGEDAE